MTVSGIALRPSCYLTTSSDDDTAILCFSLINVEISRVMRTMLPTGFHCTYMREWLAMQVETDESDEHAAALRRSGG